MYGLHVMIVPVAVTFLVVVHIVQIRMRGVVKPIEPKEAMNPRLSVPPV